MTEGVARVLKAGPSCDVVVLDVQDPFDAEASRGYGRIYAAVVASGRKARGARAVDLLIAAAACSAGLPLYTRNPDDFRMLGALVEVIAI